MDPRSGLRLRVITTQRRLIASRLLFVLPRGSVFLCHSCWASASVRLAILRSVFRSFSTSKRHHFTTHTLRGQIVRWNFVIFSISVKNARRAMVRGPSTLWVLRVWLFEDFLKGSPQWRVSASVRSVCARCFFFHSGGVDLLPHCDSVGRRECSVFKTRGGKELNLVSRLRGQLRKKKKKT